MTRNFFGPIQEIIPWATNQFTEQLVSRVKTLHGEDYLGFWMLGGMSGGGMGFIVNPETKSDAQKLIMQEMCIIKNRLEHALPFAVDPLAQFEKLWGDMVTLDNARCRFIEVARMRGQQLKEPLQLDGWRRDGSYKYVNSLCSWGQ